MKSAQKSKSSPRNQPALGHPASVLFAALRARRRPDRGERDDCQATGHDRKLRAARDAGVDTDAGIGSPPGTTDDNNDLPAPSTARGGWAPAGTATEVQPDDIERTTRERVHEVLAANAKHRGNGARARPRAPLRGLTRCNALQLNEDGAHTRRRGRLYRYYSASG